MALERVRSLLLGSAVRIVVTALLGLVVLGVVATATGLLGAPTVEGVDNRFGAVNGSTTTIESDLHVSNPNPVGVQLGGTTVDYGIAMNGLVMANGTKEGVAIERGNSTLQFTTYLRNERIPAWWVSHLRNGEHTTLAVNADVHSSLAGASVGAPTVERDVDTDVSAAFNSTETRPIDANQPVVSDPVLYLNETSGRWGEVTDAETPIEMSFTVYNPKPYLITASSIGYDVSMNDVAVGNGSTEQGVTVPPGESRTIQATTVIENDALDEWWVTHLERDQTTTLAIQFYARFDLSAGGGGTVRVPLDSVEHTFETDMFGTKNETDVGTGDRTTPSDDESSGAEGEQTATETTAEAIPTETTDDGILSGDETTVADDTPTETATDEPTATTDGGGLL